MAEKEAINILKACEAEGKESESLKFAIAALEEIEQYRAIGTVEELRDAVEKQKAKKGKVLVDGVLAICPKCSRRIGHGANDYCVCCGQRLLWE